MRNKKGLVLISLGIVLILLALGLVVWNLQEQAHAAVTSDAALAFLEEQVPDAEVVVSGANNGFTEDVYTQQLAGYAEIEIPDYLLDPEREMPVLNHEGQDYIGTLSLPALGLELPIISQWSYPALKLAPCRYTGSAYLDDLVLMGHNYTSHFRTLPDLQVGDRVVFTDVDGNTFTYEVAVKETLPPTAVEEMTAGDWPLTLFTCTVGGTSRFTVRCDKVE